jgi:hypothetical protein
MKQLYVSCVSTVYSCAVLGQKGKNSTLNILKERQLTEAYRIEKVVLYSVLTFMHDLYTRCETGCCIALVTVVGTNLLLF